MGSVLNSSCTFLRPVLLTDSSIFMTESRHLEKYSTLPLWISGIQNTSVKEDSRASQLIDFSNLSETIFRRGKVREQSASSPILFQTSRVRLVRVVPQRASIHSCARMSTPARIFRNRYFFSIVRC